MTTSTPPTRDQLREHLVTHRIAGDVATSRQSNLTNIGRMLDRAPEYWFGLELARSWTADEVLKVMALRVGLDPDPARTSGADRIDPDLCLDALDSARVALDRVRSDRGRVLLATGHPTGTLALLLPLATALAGAGCTLLAAGDGDWIEVLGERRRIRYVGGVATVGTGGDLMHTHSPEPMQHALSAASAPPDLVVADHGWAGAAAQAGIPTVGFADTNDPAMFVGAEEGKVTVAVPVDDNVLPVAYGALSAYLVGPLH